MSLLQMYTAFKQLQCRSAATAYGELCKYYPDVPSYRLYYAQCLAKAGLYPEASKAALRVDSDQYRMRLLQLQACIKYEEDDLPAARSLLGQTPADEPDTLINAACITYKEGNYEAARAAFLEAAQSVGQTPPLMYNIALCQYAMRSYAAASKTLQDIIERGVRAHPELSVGSATDGVEVRSVGNTNILRETALVEAFNLKAAIQYNLKDFESAKEALSDMPPRSEEELDSVTLHNSALLNMEADPTTGFRKFNFLLTHPPFPPETFGNLLLLYIKYGCYDLAADIMAQNAHLTFKYLTPELYEFLDATICVQTSPEEAYRKYDILTAKHIEALRRHTKAIQDARLARDNEGIKNALKLYDETLERYIPVLMGMARIYWDRYNYPQVEKIFRQSAEFASEHETWKLNVAHTFFMQEGKYKEAIRYYEPLIKKHWDNLLDVTAIVLANVCVAYIMTNQNEEAEEIMRRVEAEEERVSASQPDKPIFHLCIINLVIGTLYSSKGNFEFGISRILKSLEPLDRKLGTDTWYYAKRCFLSLAESLSKHMVMLREGVIGDILSFLEDAELHGKHVMTVIQQGATGDAATGSASSGGDSDGNTNSNMNTNIHNSNNSHAVGRNVSVEARMLKKLFMQLRDEH